MQRLMMSFGFSALLFVAGLLAGQGVHSVSGGSVASVETAGLQADFAKQAFADSIQSDIAPAPFRTVSKERLSSDDAADLTNSDLSSVPADQPLEVEQPPETKSPVLRDSIGRRNVLQLIGRIFPNADRETAEVWADVYADMDLSEVEFILEQKRQLSGTLDVAGSGSIAGPSAMLAVRPDPYSDQTAPVAAAVRAVRHNLRGAWSIGFRRTVVLPEVVDHAESMPDRQRQQTRSTMFVCFDAGRTISSPLGTHVALPAGDGSLMFQLEDKRLTRRGDFQLLPDRRLGLITQAGNYAIENSPTIPETASGIRITASGEIDYDDASVGTVTAGQLRVWRVTDLSKLKTTDGVIFTMESAELVSGVSTAEAALRTNMLEISNVDPDEDRRLLEHLNSLMPISYD